MARPTENLIRLVEWPTARAELRDDGDGNTMVGYPIVYDTWTEIDSVWEGTFKERIAQGALSKTLQERGDRVQVLFNHGFDPQLGDKPLGVPKVQREEKAGLYVEVELDRARSVQEEIIPRLRSGSLAGMSFRFSVTKEEWAEPDNGLPERTITELKLYEYGPVTFPAYQATSVGIRSLADYRRFREELQEAATTPAGAGSTFADRQRQLLEVKPK